MAKDPVDRYQSARGLLHDLERCLRERRGFEIPPFDLGQEDIPEHLEIPDRLYGRAREVGQLLEAFERTRQGGAELLLLDGPSGIGKTALIESLQPELAESAGYFTTGKFEQFRSNVPLLGLTQALSRLIDRLLIEDEGRINRWKQRLSDGLDSTAAVLVPLIPPLVHFVGPQHEAPELGAIESRNRLLLALGRLISLIAATEHPVVLFLDDLQWSDPISLRVIEHFIAVADAKGLLLIGAYRSDEVDAEHPLRGVAGRLKDTTEIHLEPLSTTAVTELISDALHVEMSKAHELATSLAGRTDNNPLLVRQFLLLLERDGALFHGANGWTWSTDAVRKSKIPSDALGMIRAKLEQLSAQQRMVLAAATCVGSRFEVASLAAALQENPADLLPHLIALTDEGLLALTDTEVCFTHDRIEEGARHWLESESERQYHKRLGKHLLATTSDEQFRERLYEIVEHLNWTIEDESDGARLLQLANLDLEAGQAGLQASAPTMAEQHLGAGLRALKRVEELQP
ncbi:MAG: AAA family ATPase, partial [Myxococcales bacterium]|nr:AAA family ATPase [Myxococcales bacterium]